MRTLLILLQLSTVASLALADKWSRVDIVNTEPVVTYMENAGKHTLGPDEYPADYSFPQVATRYWKKQGNDWVEMSQPDKDAVDDAIKEEAIADDPKLDALLDALAPELKLTKDELKAKLKNKMDAGKVKKKEKK